MQVPFIASAKCYDVQSCLRNQRCMYGKMNDDKKWENCFTPPCSDLPTTPTEVQP
jgi:hypothetical protein